MRITLFIVTAIVALAAAVFGFFVVLLGLNGFSERQATPSLIFYIVSSLAGSLGLSLGATLAAKAIVNKGRLGKAGAAIVSILFTSIAGIVFIVALVFLSFVIASAML